MKHQNRMSLLSLLLLGVMLAGCVAPVAAPGSTSAPPTATLQPPTATPVPPTATPAPPTATPVPQEATSPTAVPAATGKVELKLGKITSQALVGNLLGDPNTRRYLVLLPPNYATSDKRYPVVYVLHYYPGDAYTDVGNIMNAYQKADAEGDIQEMIFVFPDASNKLGGSLYLSSPTIGDYDTYITKELVELIDATYRTIPDPANRGITGCSMGADGSMTLALKHPDVFSVVAPMSGGFNWTTDSIWNDAAEIMEDVPEDFDDFQRIEWWKQWFYALVAATASNPEKPPFYLDMPFAIADGEAQIVPEVFDRITEADTVHALDRYLSQPERLEAISIYHDPKDTIVPVEQARAFDKLLTDRGVDHEYVEMSLSHCDLASQGYVPIVQFMSDNLAGEPAE